MAIALDTARPIEYRCLVLRFCIVTGGEGPLKTAVEDYGLGVWVEPDSLDSLKAGIKRWQESRIQPQWERYCLENSWPANAKRVMECFSDAGTGGS